MRYPHAREQIEMDTPASRHLVVSAVNLTEGGTLTVLIESLDAAVATLGDEWRITALVHDHRLIANQRVRTIAFPRAKRRWVNRIWLEWYGFRALSRELKADLWFSLHDMTPLVEAKRQAVYFHNPSPFYKPSFTEARFDPVFFVFNKMYMRLYALFVRRNDAVIVQQSWLRDAFRERLGHPNIVVAHPDTREIARGGARRAGAGSLRQPTPDRPLRLLYPALPRVFKNMEVLCEAWKLLPLELGRLINLRLTFDRKEGRWARELADRYGGLAGISLLGRRDRAKMTTEYEDCDLVLFPSRLETWGLPISEAKSFGKPLLVADLPYARETVGTYDAVSFAAPNDAGAWADQFTAMATGAWTPDGHVAVPPAQPFFGDWPSLWNYLVKL